MEIVEKELEGVSVLVNNAGIARAQRLDEITERPGRSKRLADTWDPSQMPLRLISRRWVIRSSICWTAHSKAIGA
jgi:hypothetical protein